MEKLLFAGRSKQELHAIALAVLALPVAKIHADDGLARRQQVALGDEIEPEVSDLRRRPEPPGDVDRESTTSIGDPGENTDVVDHRLRFVAPASGNSYLELARQLQIHLVKEEMAADGECMGRHVEKLVLDDTAVWRGGDVAHAISASADGGHAGLGEDLDNLDGILELEVVDLDVLTNGDVRAATAPPGRYFGEGVELVGGHDATRNLDPLHVLHVGKLRVKTHSQPEGSELFGGQLSPAIAGDVRGQASNCFVLQPAVLVRHLRLLDNGEEIIVPFSDLSTRE